MAVPIDERGHVRCPSCGDHFPVEGTQLPKPTPNHHGTNCPKCGELLSLDSMRHEDSGVGWVGQERMWYCPKCMAVLGFTAWKR